MNVMDMRTFCTATALAVAMTFSASAQDAKLTGTWRLNLAKSFLGGQHPSSDYQFTTIFAVQNGAIDERDIARNQSLFGVTLPDSKSSMNYATDGKEHEAQAPAQFPGLPPTSITITAEWQGNTLFVTERGNTFRGAVTTHRRYFLSSDGRELKEIVKTHNLSGDLDQRLVFERSAPTGSENTGN